LLRGKRGRRKYSGSRIRYTRKGGTLPFACKGWVERQRKKRARVESEPRNRKSSGKGKLIDRSQNPSGIGADQEVKLSPKILGGKRIGGIQVKDLNRRRESSGNFFVVSRPKKTGGGGKGSDGNL